MLSRSQIFLKKYLGEFLLLAMVLISLFTYGDYGLTWDEPRQRDIGKIAYEYAIYGDDAMLTWVDKDYGVAFEIPLIIAEEMLGLKDSRDVYLMRHLLTHLFFLFGAFLAFKTIDLIFKNKMLATIGFLLLVLHPRLYAHSFFNTKDLPFLSMFLVCFYLSIQAFMTQKMKYFILLSVTTGLLINMRIMGGLMFAAILTFLLIDIVRTRKKQHIIQTLVFIPLTCLTLYISWPYLWINPIGNFVEAFENMSKFRWDSLVRVASQDIRAFDLPFWYWFVWVGVTTPIAYLLLGIFGFARVSIDIFKKPLAVFENGNMRPKVLFLGCFILPVIVVIALQSVMYDGWRQTYFVYAGWVMVMIYGLNALIKTKFANLYKGVLFVSFAYTAFFMIKNHPHQQVYFNPIVSMAKNNHARKNYEMDYWGASFKTCLEHLLEKETTDIIKVFVGEGGSYPARVNKKILKPNERERIHFVNREEADFFVTNFRGHYQDYEELKGQEYFSLKIGNNVIAEIYKLK